MIAKHKGEIPVVILLLPLIAGICFGLTQFNTSGTGIAIVATLTVVFFVTLNSFYNRFGVFKQRWVGGILIHILLFLFGWINTSRHNESLQADHFSNRPAQYLDVVINSEPAVKNDLTRFTARVKHSINNGKAEDASGTLMITINDELAKNLFYGEELIVPANYSPVEPPYNPGEFNYKKYLANKNIYHQEFLYPKQYRIVTAGKGNPTVAYALQLRQNLVKKLQTNMTDTAAIAIASTLILGYKADLSNDILQAYSKTGTIHILSVSGGHVAIIYLLLGWMLGFLKTHKNGRITQAVIIITLIWAYAMITGLSPAVCRAAVMLSLIVSGKAYNRYINTLNILAVSAFAMLLYDPFLLTDVGFQLSYLAVAGLVIFQPMIFGWIKSKHSLVNKIWLACSVSIAAQVITFPLSAYYFHQFPLYFLVSNLLIVIPVSIIIYTGMALLLLPQVSGVSRALGYVLEHCIIYMNKGLGMIEHAPLASVNKIWLSKFEYLVLYAIIIALFYFIHNRRAKYLQTALVCLLAFSVSIGIKKVRADMMQSITFLNLRKHTGIVFKNGNKGVVLTDLPESDNYFKYAVQPGLDSSRITNYLVIHPDSNASLPYFVKHGNALQFFYKKMLLVDKDMRYATASVDLKFDYLFMTNNAQVPTTLLYKHGTVVLNADNSPEYTNSAMRLRLKGSGNYHLLQRNKSLTEVSNEY